ncbi:MAG: molybdopterin-binding protein [Faecalibacillus faecis]
MFKVNREELFKVNSFGKMMIATRQGNVPVKKGINLQVCVLFHSLLKKKDATNPRKIQKPILKIMPYQIKTAGIITTGSEVYKGRIKDTFTPVIVEKLKEYGVEVTYHSLSLDDHEMTTSKINEALKQGVDLVLCTGGMSVDPDDKTPLAIKNTGAKIISYGAPVLPGAMFLLSYKGDVPIVGLPGCVMYSRRTILILFYQDFLLKI